METVVESLVASGRLCSLCAQREKALRLLEGSVRSLDSFHNNCT
jgi:hypothetical protein